MKPEMQKNTASFENKSMFDDIAIHSNRSTYQFQFSNMNIDTKPKPVYVNGLKESLKVSFVSSTRRAVQNTEDDISQVHFRTNNLSVLNLYKKLHKIFVANRVSQFFKAKPRYARAFLYAFLFLAMGNWFTAAFTMQNYGNSGAPALGTKLTDKSVEIAFSKILGVVEKSDANKKIANEKWFGTRGEVPAVMGLQTFRVLPLGIGKERAALSNISFLLLTDHSELVLKDNSDESYKLAHVQQCGKGFLYEIQPTDRAVLFKWEKFNNPKKSLYRYALVPNSSGQKNDFCGLLTKFISEDKEVKNNAK